MLLSFWIRIQELIPYHYSFCSSSCCCWGRHCSKKPGSIVSDRIRMKFDRIVLHENTHQLMESVLIWRHTFKISSMMLFHTEKCCHLLSVRASASSPSAGCPPAILSTVPDLSYFRTCCKTSLIFWVTLVTVEQHQTLLWVTLSNLQRWFQLGY